jgi:hypothetical protein
MREELPRPPSFPPTVVVQVEGMEGGKGQKAVFNDEFSLEE